MTTKTKQRLFTFEEFCIIIGEDQKADLIDGVIHMASPENTDANELFMWLGALLEIYVEEKELGRVYGSRVAFRLANLQGPEPDLAFVRKDRLIFVLPRRKRLHRRAQSRGSEDTTLISGRAEGQSMTTPCRGVTRRSFLADTGMGLTGLALAVMLDEESHAAAPRLRGLTQPGSPL